MKALQKIFKDKQVTTVEWVILSLAIVFPLISFLYMDTNSVIRCGIDLFKSVFEGQFFDYYDYNKSSQLAGLAAHPPTYDIIFYIIIGIWELPIALIEFFSGQTLQDNAFALIYSKMFLFLFIVLSAKMIRKIAVELRISESHTRWAQFMFLTSAFIFSYTCIVGQYDIVGLFFSLVGVYYYLKGDMLKFGILFAIAVQFKFFPIFVFLPLLLLREKKIWKILAYLVAPIVTLFVFKLPFLDDNAMAEKDLLSGEMFERILGNRIPIFEAEVPLSFLLVGAVCIYCYLKEVKEEEMGYYTIYIPFLTLGVLFLAFPFFPYWIVYLTPWFPLLFFMRKELREKSLLIEFGMSAGIIFAQYSHFDWVFELYNTKKMFLDKFIFPFEDFGNPFTISNIVTVFGISEFEDLFYGLYILCLITLLILYRPTQKLQYMDEDFNSKKILWCRFAAQYVVGALPFGLYFLSLVREWVF